MLEHIFTVHTGLPSTRDGARHVIKEEVMKEIGAEIERFHRKYEESRVLISNMRKNFLKELHNLKAVETFNRGSS